MHKNTNIKYTKLEDARLDKQEMRIFFLIKW